MIAQVVASNNTSTPFDPSSDLVIILHGFTGSVSSKSVTLIRNGRFLIFDAFPFVYCCTLICFLIGTSLFLQPYCSN